MPPKPNPGDVFAGHRFLGGDPNRPESWLDLSSSPPSPEMRESTLGKVVGSYRDDPYAELRGMGYGATLVAPAIAAEVAPAKLVGTLSGAYGGYEVGKKFGWPGKIIGPITGGIVGLRGGKAVESILDRFGLREAEAPYTGLSKEHVALLNRGAGRAYEPLEEARVGYRPPMRLTPKELEPNSLIPSEAHEVEMPPNLSTAAIRRMHGSIGKAYDPIEGSPSYERATSRPFQRPLRVTPVSERPTISGTVIAGTRSTPGEYEAATLAKKPIVTPAEGKREADIFGAARVRVRPGEGVAKRIRRLIGGLYPARTPRGTPNVPLI